MGNSDIDEQRLSKKSAKAWVHHSNISEHFQGSFPLFLNLWEEGFDLREHEHAYLEMVYVMSGEGYHYVSDRVERTTKGCLYILPVGTSHIMRPSGASARSKLLVYNLCIRPEFVLELKNWLTPYNNGGEPFKLFDGTPGTHIALVDKDLKLGQWFEQLHREFIQKQLGYEASMFAGLLQLMVYITRLLNQEVPSLSSIQTARSADLTNILDYINMHVTESLTVKQLALKTNMSQRHFIRVFRQSTGMGFSDYVQHRRMEYACKLLLETDYKIAYIAICTGYQDTAHFREVFRKLMGTSPRKYRMCNKTL